METNCFIVTKLNHAITIRVETDNSIGLVNHKALFFTLSNLKNEEDETTVCYVK